LNSLAGVDVTPHGKVRVLVSNTEFGQGTNTVLTQIGCLVPVLQAEGASIQTVEGLAANGKLNPLQQAFLNCGGAQCGICTPGMLMAATQLLDRNPHPGLAEIREGLAGNLCRCTGFIRIFESVFAAAALTTEQSEEQAGHAR
jgi:carbon-monoxide dehydrogenase small subunit